MRSKDQILLESLYSEIYKSKIEKLIESWIVSPYDIINEDITDIGGGYRNFPDDKAAEWLDRIGRGAKTKGDRMSLPYIHRGLINDNEPNSKEEREKYTKGEGEYKIHKIDIINDDGKIIKKEYDINEFKRLISQRPREIVAQNSKMVKSRTDEKEFYNTSLPALRGLILDEKSNELKIVTTCPSAGKCAMYCYAKKGGYVQWMGSSLKQTRILNFLFNDWKGYKDQILSELKEKVALNSKKGKIVQLRWNDSGDLLSPKYFEIVMDIANSTPNVEHYIYTKEVGLAHQYQSKMKNVIFNFSFGGTQDDEINLDTDKVSHVVDEDKTNKGKKHKVEVPGAFMFKSLITKKEINGDEKWVYNDESSIKEFKNRMASKYSLNPDKILTIDELKKTPEGSPLEYNVIVLPGESDLSASRRDVKGTYLIIH